MKLIPLLTLVAVGLVWVPTIGAAETARGPASLEERRVQRKQAANRPRRVMRDFGWKSGIEIFWSFRVNDTHDGSTADYGPIMFAANQLKREHPEWLIGSPTQKPKLGA